MKPFDEVLMLEAEVDEDEDVDEDVEVVHGYHTRKRKASYD